MLHAETSFSQCSLSTNINFENSKIKEYKTASSRAFFHSILLGSKGTETTVPLGCVSATANSHVCLQVATTPSLVTSSTATTLTVNPVLSLPSPAAVTNLSVTGRATHRQTSAPGSPWSEPAAVSALGFGAPIN